MLAFAPENIKPQTVVPEMIQNIDLASTVMNALNVPIPESAKFAGQSFLPLLQGKKIPWRKHILYEYHWEWNFPATPTLFAIRTERYKYIYYHGVWDHNGFYDLQSDPHERHNLIRVPTFQADIKRLRTQMFQELEAIGGLNIPVRPPAGERLDDRKLKR